MKIDFYKIYRPIFGRFSFTKSWQYTLDFVGFYRIIDTQPSDSPEKANHGFLPTRFDRPQRSEEMKVSRLFDAVRLYGLDVLLLGLLARLLNGLSKKLAAASAAVSELATRRKEARAQRCASQENAPL
ncbi:MAG: hypothetical protein IJX18_02915 [Clostridia bacterium]|nr:hypothetical protein [Clostridia bacterium]